MFFSNAKIKQLKLNSNPLYSKATLANLNNDCEFACDCDCMILFHGFFTEMTAVQFIVNVEVLFSLALSISTFL